MKTVVCLFVLMAAAIPSFAYVSLPLDQMQCSGPFPTGFFVGLSPRPDLNNYIAKLGQDPNTFYKYELIGDVYTSKPTFQGDHLEEEEYVFLTNTEDIGFSVSRFFMSSSLGFVLLTQHPAEHLPDLKILQYRPGDSLHPPDWVCRY